MRNRPPKRRRRSGPEKGWPNGLNSGRVSRMMPVRESSSKMRVTMASVRPDTGARLIAGGQLTGQDRDENDVVDAEDDLEHRQREQRDPGFGRGEPGHGPKGEDRGKIMRSVECGMRSINAGIAQ